MIQNNGHKHYQDKDVHISKSFIYIETWYIYRCIDSSNILWTYPFSRETNIQQTISILFGQKYRKSLKMWEQFLTKFEKHDEQCLLLPHCFPNVSVAEASGSICMSERDKAVQK